MSATSTSFCREAQWIKLRENADMPIQVTCAGCQRKLSVPDEAAGKRARCPRCQQVIVIPAAGSTGDGVTGRSKVRGSTAAKGPTGPTSEQWYVQTADEQQFGPISRSEMNQWKQQGRIVADCQLLRHGDEQWQWAADVYPELAVPQPAVGVASVSPANPFDIGQPSSNPYASPAATSRSRGQAPGGRKSGAVTGVAIVNFIIGGLQLTCGLFFSIFGLIGGAALASVMNEAAQQDPDMNSQEAVAAVGIVGVVLIGLGIFLLLIACAFLLAGFGVLKRRQWGRIVSFILGGLSGVMTLVGAVSLLMGNVVAIVSMLMYGGYAALVFTVLLDRRNAAEFR